MNTVRCSNCAAENAADLKFCTNCGNPLPPANYSQSSGTNPSAQPSPPAKSAFGRNAAIFGGVGCVLLLLGAVALCGVLSYLGRNSGNGNSANISVSNDNSLLANRGTIKSSNSNSVIFGDNNNSPSNDNSSNANRRSSGPPTDEEFRNFLPPQIGEYEREGDASDGNVTEDYPGADKITKSDYAKKNKKVSVVVAQFASPAVAKQSYGYFLDGFKNAKARILTRQKVKNKTGIETGDLAIFVYKSKWETLVYADRFGFRITASDRATLVEFLKAFGGYIELASSN